MSINKISKANVLAGLDKAMADYSVMALTKKGEKTLYDKVADSKEIKLDYTPTILSPKKFFFPKEEVILEYTADGAVQAKVEAKPTVLFGIRPCDLNAIAIMDEAFAESNGDPNYITKREKSVVIGIDCNALCDKDAFCFRVNSQTAVGGYDVMLTPVGSEYILEAKTAKGQKFVDKYLPAQSGGEAELASFQKSKAEVFEKAGGPFQGLANLPELFEKGKKHKVWEEEGSRCLSCGSCIMVCPTCYCFDVADEMALSLKSGQRIRRWDACMLNSFAEVAGGENFREHATQRLHHRIDRKFNFLMKKHGKSVCVGCGRCVRACLAEISPQTIAQEIIKTHA